MSLDLALRLTEILLALAFLQHSAEHIWAFKSERPLFTLRALFSVVLLTGFQSQWVLLALSIHSLFVLYRFNGPYNGGSDKMGLLILYCLTLARWLPDGPAQEIAFGYLGLQLTLSYFISGQVKIVNPDWRSGQALKEVFAYSAYPVSEDLRKLAERPRLLWLASWAVIIFELMFPLTLLHPYALYPALVLTASFHLANACLFGLNRFVWAWIAAYPSIVWMQARLF